MSRSSTNLRWYGRCDSARRIQAWTCQIPLMGLRWSVTSGFSFGLTVHAVGLLYFLRFLVVCQWRHAFAMDCADHFRPRCSNHAAISFHVSPFLWSTSVMGPTSSAVTYGTAFG